MGEQYYSSVRQSLNELEVATQRVIAGPDTNSVKLSVAPNFLVRWLLPRMQHFQERHPEIELQISTSIAEIDFTATNIDMAVYFGYGDWDDVEVIYLNHFDQIPVCSPGLLHKEHPLQQPEDLRHHTLIHVSSRLHEWPEWLSLAGIEYRGFERGLQFSNSQLATAAAQEGLGVALGDLTLSSREIEKGQLVVPFDIALDTHKSFYLVYRKGRPETPAMKAFREWVIEEMSS